MAVRSSGNVGFVGSKRKDPTTPSTPATPLTLSSFFPSFLPPRSISPPPTPPTPSALGPSPAEATSLIKRAKKEKPDDEKAGVQKKKKGGKKKKTKSSLVVSAVKAFEKMWISEDAKKWTPTPPAQAFTLIPVENNKALLPAAATCVICHKLALGPHVSKDPTCEHTFCSVCLHRKEIDVVMHFNCPLVRCDCDSEAKCHNKHEPCGKLVTPDIVEPFRKLLLQCVFGGLFKCPINADKGCRFEGTHDQLEQHAEHSCQWRLVQCQWGDCKQFIHHIDMRKHEELNCLGLVHCPGRVAPKNPCYASIERRMLEHHITVDCPKTLVPCPLAHKGCAVHIPRDELDKHRIAFVNDHEALFLAWGAEKDEQIRTLKAQLETKTKAQEEMPLLLEPPVPEAGKDNEESEKKKEATEKKKEGKRTGIKTKTKKEEVGKTKKEKKEEEAGQSDEEEEDEEEEDNDDDEEKNGEEYGPADDEEGDDDDDEEEEENEKEKQNGDKPATAASIVAAPSTPADPATATLLSPPNSRTEGPRHTPSTASFFSSSAATLQELPPLISLGSLAAFGSQLEASMSAMSSIVAPETPAPVPASSSASAAAVATTDVEGSTPASILCLYGPVPGALTPESHLTGFTLAHGSPMRWKPFRATNALSLSRSGAATIGDDLNGRVFITGGVISGGGAVVVETVATISPKKAGRPKKEEKKTKKLAAVVGPALNSMECYDVVKETWVEAKSLQQMNHGRRFHAAAWCVTPDGKRKLFVSGGLDSTSTAMTSVESYDLETNTWQLEPPLPAPVYGHQMIAFDQKLYVVAFDDNHAWRLDFTTRLWEPLPPFLRTEGFGSAAGVEEAFLRASRFVVVDPDGLAERLIFFGRDCITQCFIPSTSPPVWQNLGFQAPVRMLKSAERVLPGNVTATCSRGVIIVAIRIKRNGEDSKTDGETLWRMDPRGNQSWAVISNQRTIPGTIFPCCYSPSSHSFLHL